LNPRREGAKGKALPSRERLPLELIKRRGRQGKEALQESRSPGKKNSSKRKREEGESSLQEKRGKKEEVVSITGGVVSRSGERKKLVRPKKVGAHLLNRGKKSSTGGKGGKVRLPRKIFSFR